MNNNELLETYKNNLALESKKENENLELKLANLKELVFERKKALLEELKINKQMNFQLSKKCMDLSSKNSCVECINFHCKNYISIEDILFSKKFKK